MVEDRIVLTEKQLTASRVLAKKDKKYYMFYGSSRAGKTFLMCYFIRHRARKYEGSKHLVARFSFANAKKTIWIQTLYPLLREDEKRKLCKINQQEGICRYNNGSIIMLGGLEPSRIDSVLAAEYGTIFITEANENRFKQVEMLFSRLNDTSKDSNGNIIPLKFVCDLNPTVKNHWTNVLFRMGLDPVTGDPRHNFHEFISLHFRAEDNQENLAPGYVESLKNMSPALRKRFYDGEFGAYEGLVYVIDEEVHIVDDFQIPPEWSKFRSIDFGYVHPFVCLWGAYNASDEVLYIYQEYYVTRTTVRVHSDNINKLSMNDKINWTVSDHDAEDRATLQENGISTLPAYKEVLAGIDRMEELLRHDENKRTNIKVFRSCKNTITEFFSYIWKENSAGIVAKDREVVKENDDCMDALRYMAMRVFNIRNTPGVISGAKGFDVDSSKSWEDVKKDGIKKAGSIGNPLGFFKR